MVTEMTDSLTVLAVDDSPIVHQLVKRALEPEYHVLVADNAIDALSMIYHDAVSVILLDVMMPGVDGLEFCRTVRNLPQFEHLPIVMVTSKGSPFDRMQGRVAGATDYLIKPFEAEQLQQIVRKLTHNIASASA